MDAFFLQIQGSGVVTLEEGGQVHVGYDAQNGQAYTAIGKELVNRGALAKGQVTMQSIRAWLKAHPDQAAEVAGIVRSVDPRTDRMLPPRVIDVGLPPFSIGFTP